MHPPPLVGHQRGGYVKPAEGKPPYGGRGGYPGQPVKRGAGAGGHRANGIVPAKGPPLSLPMGGHRHPFEMVSNRFFFLWEQQLNKQHHNVYAKNQTQECQVTLLKIKFICHLILLVNRFLYFFYYEPDTDPPHAIVIYSPEALPHWSIHIVRRIILSSAKRKNLSSR